MNNLNLYFKISILFLCVFLLQGCLKSNDDYSNLSIGTVRMIDEEPTTLYFQLDLKKNLYPNSLQFYGAKELKEKDRVFIEYTDAQEKKSGYTANIVSTHLVQTKPIILEADQEKLETYLNESAKINISEVYIVNDFLTLKYTCLGKNKDSDQNTINLYALADSNRTGAALHLYLTHNGEDTEGSQYSGIISFPIDKLKALISPSTQVYIKSHTIYNGIEEHIIKITDIDE